MPVSSFGRNVKALREANNLTQQQFGESIGVTQTTVGSWETRDKRPKSPALISAICEVYGVSERDLFGYSDGYYARAYGLTGDMAAPVPMETTAPVLGYVHAGDPSEAIEFTGEVHYVPPGVLETYPGGFVLAISGDSMDRVIPDGSFAYFAPQEQFPARSGDVIAIKVNGDDVTVKRVKITEGLLILEPDSTNPEHKRRVIDSTDPDSPYVRILGKAVWFDVRMG